MHETRISICDRRGIYPTQTVLCDIVGYACFKGIPLWLNAIEMSPLSSMQKDPSEELLQAGFLMTRRGFPAFSVFPFGSASVIIQTEKKPNLPTVLSQVKRILSGGKSVPLLYDPYRHDSLGAKEAQKKIKEIRSEHEYVDLFRCTKKPFHKQVEEWSHSFEFSKHNLSPLAVKRYYNMFTKSSRFIHIALHYFVTAARLIHNDFVEDGGLNLQLTVEALIRDFMEWHSIGNKKTAAQRFQDSILLPYGHMEFLEELYDARNLFLAHIDEDMFTESQNIDDPDRYCYEHYESVSWLITRYVRHKNRAQPMN